MESCSSKFLMSPFGKFSQTINYIERYFLFEYFLMLSFVNKKYYAKFNTLLRLQTPLEGFFKSILGKSNFHPFYMYRCNFSTTFNSSFDNILNFDNYVVRKRNKVICFWIQMYYRYFDFGQVDTTYEKSGANFLYYCYRDARPKNIDGFKFCQRWKINICKIKCLNLAIYMRDLEYVKFLLGKYSYGRRNIHEFLDLAIACKNNEIYKTIIKYL